MMKCVPHNRFLRYLFLATLFLLITIRVSLGVIEYSYADEVDLVTNFPISSQVFDRNGVLLYEYFDEIRRIPVEKNLIPSYLRHATLMAEDERFFLHAGFDPIGIVRAFWKNVKAGGIAEGGSTLGQQLIKNTVLGPSEGYSDKIEEILFSIAVDARLSKQDILDLYLNTIPYGSNVYGVEAASRFYFDKHVEELTLSESAVLASLPKHPTFLSPYGDNLEQLFERRDYILGKMLEKKYITELQYSSAITDRLTFNNPEIEIKAPHFVMMVKDDLVKKYGLDVVQEGGLQITTSLDYEMQNKIEQIIENDDDVLEKHNANSVGVVAINPKNGEILAMIGNKDYFDTENAGNYNMTTAERQPGSSFKPLVYAALLEQKNYSPASILLDIPKNFAAPEMDVYIPRNYDNRYRGPVTVRNSLSQSLNVPAVQALMEVGIDEVIDLATDFGINTFKDRSRYGPSLVLGGGEVRLLDLAAAYSVFANQGVYNQVQSILNIKSLDGNYFELRSSLSKQVLYPETAYQVTSILSDNVARSPVFGRNSVLSFYDRPVAAKTGTTQEYRDAWTMGYSPDIVVGVWVGNHDNTPLKYGSAGVFAAGPIWRATMDVILEDQEIKQFEIPKYLKTRDVYTLAGKQVEYIAPWQEESFNKMLAWQAFRLKAQNEIHPNQTVD